MNNYRIIIYDFEVFRYLWMMVALDYESKEKVVIYNDREKLEEYYNNHRNDIWVGYNSRTYDQYILKGLLLGYEAYYVNNSIILEERDGWNVVKDNEKILLYSFDLFTGFHSLKQLEGFMGSMIKETDIPFDLDRELTREEIEQVVFYCTHDVEETAKVFTALKSEFDSQLLLIEAFNLPMTMFNKTKAQLAAHILGARRSPGRNDEFDLIFPDTLKLSDKYKHIYDWYKDRRNRDYKKSFVTEVAGVPHIFAWGGLHAARPNCIEEGIILHADVASLYPSIMIEYDFLSRNIEDKDKFREIRDKRLKLKAEKNPIQAPLKIVINAVFGATKDKQNPLYDPRQANNVCVAGQLLILDLIEKLEDHCKLLQSNTDGIILLVDSQEKIDEIKGIASEWERRTRLKLEWETHTKIVQKDVNNYVLINEDGTYESKGAYVKALKSIDYDLPIVNKSLVEYFTKGIPLKDTILNCNSFIEFQKIVKITSLYQYALHGENQLKEKVLRVYASNKEEAKGVFKVKTPNKIEKIANTPDKCFIWNDSVIDIPCPEELDKNYYVSVAEQRLEDFIETNGKQKNVKFKSDIKFVGYEEKEFIENFNFENYKYFTELVLDLLNNKHLNKKQIGILTKLNYFERFGNSKKLLRILSILAQFKFGDIKSIKKEKISNSQTLCEIVRKYSTDKTSKGIESDAYKIFDIKSLLCECEEVMLSLDIEDFTYKEKIATQIEYCDSMIASGKDEERRVLYIKDVFPLKAKKDGKQFGYSISTKSFGSGKEAKFTVYNELYNKLPISKGDVIYCNKYDPKGIYFILKSYYILQ